MTYESTARSTISIRPARGEISRSPSVMGTSTALSTITAVYSRNRYPLVCSAIGEQDAIASSLFEESLHLKRVSIDGPLNGANTLFTFRLM